MYSLKNGFPATTESTSQLPRHGRVQLSYLVSHGVRGIAWSFDGSQAWMTPAIALQFTTPIPISSGKGKNSWTRSAADVTVTNDEAAAASISRLKTRVYNATLILSRLGKEGAENLNADGFYSSGPGDEWMPPAGFVKKRVLSGYA